MPKPPTPAERERLVHGKSIRGDDCPMCSRPMLAEDEIITCSECGGEGCMEYCIPGGRGTACTDCTDGSNHGSSSPLDHGDDNDA